MITEHRKSGLSFDRDYAGKTIVRAFLHAIGLRRLRRRFAERGTHFALGRLMLLRMNEADQLIDRSFEVRGLAKWNGSRHAW